MTLVRAAQGVVDARSAGSDLDAPIDVLADALQSHRRGDRDRVAKSRGGDQCEVVWGRECKAPPGMTLRTSAVCYSCGQPACPACSTIVDYYTYGRQRIGFDCLEQHDRRDVVEATLARRARKERYRG
jgi:hypothetical protein